MKNYLESKAHRLKDFVKGFFSEKDQPVIIRGIDQESVYSQFQPEMDMLNYAFAEVMIVGDAKGKRAS
jgi:hypothetical protein